MFAIETGVSDERYGRTRYPFDQLQPGQSFFVPADNVLARNAVRHAVAVYKRRHPGWDYTTRISDQPTLGIRVWRR